MSGKNNLINLRDMDQDRAKAIRSLGGKARQIQRKKELALHNFFNDYLKINSYYDKELELVLASKPELNSYQKEIIKKEFIKHLIERGYIRESQLTPEEAKSILTNNTELSPQDFKRYFKTRTAYKRKRGPKKKLGRPKARTKQ